MSARKSIETIWSEKYQKLLEESGALDGRRQEQIKNQIDIIDRMKDDLMAARARILDLEDQVRVSSGKDPV